MIPDKYLGWYMLNPMTSIITFYRNVIIQGKMPEISIIIYSVIQSVVVFWISYIIFKHYESRFAEEL